MGIRFAGVLLWRNSMDELAKKVRRQVLEKLDLSREMEDAELMELIVG